MEFEKIKKLLEKYYFFGHTAKRDGYRIRYTFWSVPYFAITITVEVVKVDPKDVKSPKIVTKMWINNFEIDDMQKLLSKLSCIYKLHKEKLYGGKAKASHDKPKRR